MDKYLTGAWSAWSCFPIYKLFFKYNFWIQKYNFWIKINVWIQMQAWQFIWCGRSGGEFGLCFQETHRPCSQKSNYWQKYSRYRINKLKRGQTWHELSTKWIRCDPQTTNLVSSSIKLKPVVKCCGSMFNPFIASLKCTIQSTKLMVYCREKQTPCSLTSIAREKL